MHLQAKQSISLNNSPNVTQVLGAGKCVITVKDHGKKASLFLEMEGLVGSLRGSPAWEPPGR